VNADGICWVLSALGVDKVKVAETWVRGCCPLHAEKMPSFGVKIDLEQRSHYHCFVCNGGPSQKTIYDLVHLVRKLEVRRSRDYSHVLEYIQKRERGAIVSLLTKAKAASEGFFASRPRVTVAGIAVDAGVLPPSDPAQPAGPVLPVLPESSLLPLGERPPDVESYLVSRGLDVPILDEWEVGWHPYARRISFPVRDMTGALVGISGRAYDSTTKPKFLHSEHFQKSYYLYGEYKVRTGGPGFLVEGFCDVLYLRQHGYPAVAMFGTSLSRFQAEKLTRLFSELVVIPDGDGPGWDAAKKIVNGIPMKVRMVPMEPGKDPDNLTLVELHELLGPPPTSEKC
jgi:DNA primase